MIPPSYRERKNKDGLTPHELFMIEHNDLVVKGKEWMKGTTNHCMVVAALIATIVFAAAFTISGGYNQTNGIPFFKSDIQVKISLKDMILGDGRRRCIFLLMTLKVIYVLTTPMPELVEDTTVEAIRIRAKWENDGYICRGHILNGMSDSLFDVYMNVESAKELWDSLESKYMAEDSSSKKLLDFKHTLKHGKDDLSLVQLGSHLCIKESLKAQESDKGKGREVGGPSVNMTEEGKNKHNKQYKGKNRSNENNSRSSSNKKQKLECWKCGKTGHLKGIAEVVKRTTQMMVVRERGLRTIPKTKVDAIAWWIDSGATTHVCKDCCWFKTFEPVEDGSVLYMGDEHFAPVHGK
nr:zinc finger, CCHC-type [Tanacetum cinerariifolium]